MTMSQISEFLHISNNSLTNDTKILLDFLEDTTNAQNIKQLEFGISLIKIILIVL